MVSNSVLVRFFRFVDVKNTFLFLFLMVFSSSCSAKKIENPTTTSLEIKTGADNFAAYLPLLKDKKVKVEQVDEIISELLDMASTHPLINKIARASVYVSLDGNNPIASAKAPARQLLHVTAHT